MKLIWTLLVVLVWMPVLSAQQNKLQVYAISAGFGIAASSSDTASSGFGFNLDFSTALNKNLFSFYFNSGWNMNSDGPQEEFYELNLTYGRKWTLGDLWALEGHIGVGWIGYHIESGSNFFIDLPESDVGFPLRLKLIYHPSDRIGIGLNPNVNFNSLETTYSGNLLIQYYFR